MSAILGLWTGHFIGVFGFSAIAVLILRICQVKNAGVLGGIWIALIVLLEILAVIGSQAAAAAG